MKFSEYVIGFYWKDYEYKVAGVLVFYYLLFSMVIYDFWYGVLGVDKDIFNSIFIITFTVFQQILSSCIVFKSIYGLKVDGYCWKEFKEFINRLESDKSILGGKDIVWRKNLLVFRFFSIVVLCSMLLSFFYFFSLVMGEENFEPLGLLWFYVSMNLGFFPFILLMSVKLLTCKLRDMTDE